MNCDFLLKRRKELNRSQSQVAERLGYSTQLISMWESGKGTPNAPVWGEYASLLQIDLEGFLFDKVQKTNDNCDSIRFDSEKCAKKIKRLRQSNDLTQKELAKKLNVSNKNVSAWENGSSFPKVEAFINLCNVLNCSYDDLYFAKEDIAITKNKKRIVVPLVVATSVLAVAGLTIATTMLIRNKTNNITKNYLYSEDSHWLLNDKGEEIDIASHDYQITIIKEANCTDDGEEIHKCTVCGYSKNVVVPALGHTHDGTWHYNEEYHYHLCLTDNVVFDKEAHSFDKGTLSNDGKHIIYKCLTCNKTKTVEQTDYIINGDTLEFGYYPQTVVSDTSLIETLNGLNTVDQNGYYSFEDKLYEKKTSVVSIGTSLSYNKFTNGDYISNNTEYWFVVEPIVWRILEKTDDSYLLMSDKLIDAKLYGQTNNYENSLIRQWLNNEFYNKAFTNKDIIQNTEVVNNIEGNINACPNTFDNVFLPSKFDMVNPKYGFPSSIALSCFPERIAESTDYTRISNLIIENDCHSRYCTRTPDENSGDVYSVQSSGAVVPDIIRQFTFGVRPMIKISRI